MNPKVTAAARSLPLDPTQFTWIDISDAPDIPLPERRELFRVKGVNPDDENTFDTLHLPFESFALITAPHIYREKSVFTFRRTSKKLTVYYWDLTWNKCLLTLTVSPSEKDPTRDGIGITFDIGSFGKYSEEDMHGFCRDLFQLLVIEINSLNLGLFGDTREIHTCKEGNPAINAKRRKKNKKPLYDWTTVVVQPRSKTESKGGTHASPRQHDVRGHYFRRLGKLFWRKAHKRGDPARGTVFHDYVVRSDNHGMQQPMQSGA